MKPTSELRFVRRMMPVSSDVLVQQQARMILQQKWEGWYKSGMPSRPSTWKDEWRDVPVEEE